MTDLPRDGLVAVVKRDCPTCELTVPVLAELAALPDELATPEERMRVAVRLAELGAGEILLTSMDRDGTRDGYDLALTRAVADRVDVPVVASGGVGTLDHLVAGVTEGGASAVLAASIFHFGEATIADAHRALRAAGVSVRGR